MNDDDFERLFADDIEPDPESLKKSVKKAKTSVGQRDTLLFAFVNIWVAMAELLAPMFANLAIKNSEKLNPKNNQQSTSNSSNQENGDNNA